MDKILDNHQCDLMIIRCMDFRFQKSAKEIMSFLGVKHADEISMAGGAKAVLDHHAKIFKMIKIFQNSHHGKEIAILSHRDCGAYGSSKAFKDAEAEKGKLVSDLKESAKIISDKFPSLSIKTYFLDSDGDRITYELV